MSEPAAAEQAEASPSSSNDKPGVDGMEAAAAMKSEEEFRQVNISTNKPKLEKNPLLRCFESSFGVHFSRGEYASNEIHTAKYTVLTFLPVNLFEQFLRVANLYFLIVAILQLIPGLSPTSWFTTVLPLVLVLAINAVKEAVDDYYRHVSDNEVNSRTVTVLEEGGRETHIAWRDLAVGDIVRVDCDTEIPADLVFLSSSDHAHLCYVETANLDGETNLKLKQCFPKTAGKHIADDFKAFADKYCIRAEQPTTELYTFQGAMVRRDDPDDVASHLPLTADCLLLRGCTLRKTDYVIGVVVYTGLDTRIMMNRTVSPRKVTQLERHMNILVIGMFALLFVIAALLAMGEVLWLESYWTRAWYLEYQDKYPDFGPSFVAWVLSVIRWVILLNGVIPISLYVTLEVVKVFQCHMLLNQDRAMYHKATDTPFSCKTMNLNEDLGQVQYVLSDKTGTLTQNVMGFVWSSIGGHLYGKISCAAAGLPSPAHIDLETPHSLCLDPDLLQRLGYDLNILASFGRTVGNKSMRGHATIIQAASKAPPDPAAERFLLNLAVCNTVVPAISDEGHFVYQASSPDEEALVAGAAFLGYRLHTRSNDRVVVEVLRSGDMLEYKVLAVLEFSSDRKRMSIIARCPDGRVRLFCKGADTMVMVRVRQNHSMVPSVRSHLEEMAQAGYRTLVVAERELPEPLFAKWYEQYNAASVALTDREAKVAEVSERIETELELLGATAVEDKLQDGVPEAIEALLEAGIKVWVLTGDKVETAISIALSCRLFTEDMALIEVRERDFDAAKGNVEMESAVLQGKSEEKLMEQDRLKFEYGDDGRSRVGLVVEGGALVTLLKKEHQDEFVALCDEGVKSVVCCRVTPKQKAQMVKLVQKKKKAITLGIGDGANDVGMIQAAHIGCGISGREGRAAVMASDYAFAQFKYLTRLLLLHGRASYLRNTEVVWYSFYKNWIYNLVLLFYGFVNGFSAQPLYTSGLIACFNVVFTSMPIVAFAVLEQDLSVDTVMANPGLYSSSMAGTRRSFMKEQVWWIVLATWHSLCCFFVPLYSMVTPNDDGLDDYLYAIGCTMYGAIVFTVNLRLALRTRYFTWINHVLIWLSIIIWLPFLYGYSVVWQVKPIDGTADMSGVAVSLYTRARYWLAGWILAPAMSLLPDIAYMCFQRTFFPQANHVFQELEWQLDLQNAAVKALGLTHTPKPGAAAENGAAAGANGRGSGGGAGVAESRRYASSNGGGGGGNGGMMMEDDMMMMPPGPPQQLMMGGGTQRASSVSSMRSNRSAGRYGGSLTSAV